MTVSLVSEEPGSAGLDLAAPPRRGRRRLWLGLGVVVVVAAAGGIAWVRAADSTGDSASATARPEATATVEVGTISATESWNGTLERGTPLALKSNVAGTVTRLVAQGSTVGRGDVLFRVDEQPVTLLTGLVPMYRDLVPGTTGVDVEQLEANLVALDYIGFTVDASYTSSTATAVRTWQAAVGAAVTGTVDRGAVVFAAEGGQVDNLRSTVGDVIGPGTPVLDITSTDQVVSLDADLDDLDRFAVGTAVTVLLPTGEEATGTVSSTRLVQPAPDPMAEDSAAESFVQVELALGENAAAELVGASVEVVVAVDERADVLLVPVNALLALAEGGYGLEVVASDGTTSIVPVETGLFAEGKVEVTSDDITEGTVVGAAGR